MDSGSHERIVLLNHLVSRSTTRAPAEHHPPLHSATELFEIIGKRVKDNFCIEFFDAENDEDDDALRIQGNFGRNFIRIAKMGETASDDWNYVTLLLDYIDNSVTSFPVVDVVKYEGRDLSGGENERGSFSAHMVVRLPKEGERDEGTYRCAIEAVSNVTRRNIESLLSRQLRRYAKLADWTFSVEIPGADKKGRLKSYKYHPRLELFADVGRSLFGAGEQKQLSHLMFTNRSEKQSIAQATAVTHEDVYASVEYRISAKQGPSDPDAQRNWVQSLKEYFKTRGYETRIYFRHLQGEHVSGAVHPSLEGATDLLMCPRATILTKSEPRKWVGEIQPEIRDTMRDLLNRDELWQRAK